MKNFISYSHVQAGWVSTRLVPVLKAGGVEVLIDRDGFRSGRSIVGQMDATQDQTECQVICWSADYAGSDYCQHEWRHALVKDSDFQNGLIQFLRLDDSPLPAELNWNWSTTPLWIDLRHDEPGPWRMLLDGCGGRLGVTALAWIAARDEVLDNLQRFRSVNLVVLTENSGWRQLLDDVKERLPDLALVDLQNGRTVPREGLLGAMLQGLGLNPGRLTRPHDLPEFTYGLESPRHKVRIGLTRFDLVPHRGDYDMNLFGSLRFLIADNPLRPLALCIQSRAPFRDLLPPSNELSEIGCALVELR